MSDENRTYMIKHGPFQSMLLTYPRNSGIPTSKHCGSTHARIWNTQSRKMQLFALCASYFQSTLIGYPAKATISTLGTCTKTKEIQISQ